VGVGCAALTDSISTVYIDYTVFLDRLGIPSTDTTFRGSYGVYHSIYDSFHWMTSFGDPTFEFHKASPPSS
jgi:hypothetical protein